jgi:hypothetical protein
MSNQKDAYKLKRTPTADPPDLTHFPYSLKETEERAYDVLNRALRGQQPTGEEITDLYIRLNALINHVILFRRTYSILQELAAVAIIYRDTDVGPQNLLDMLTRRLSEYDRLTDHLRATR